MFLSSSVLNVSPRLPKNVLTLFPLGVIIKSYLKSPPITKSINGSIGSPLKF